MKIATLKMAAMNALTEGTLIIKVQHVDADILKKYNYVYFFKILPHWYGEKSCNSVLLKTCPVRYWVVPSRSGNFPEISRAMGPDTSSLVTVLPVEEVSYSLVLSYLNLNKTGNADL